MFPVVQKNMRNSIFSRKNPIPHIDASLGVSSLPLGSSHQELRNAHQKVCVAWRLRRSA